MTFSAANASEPRARAILDPYRPHAFFVEREPDESGKAISVAIVFLTNRECPWRCIYCDLWRNTLTETVPPGAIAAQIDFALAQLRGTACSQIKLYNAGSFFDPKAIPPEDFPAIAERLRDFERVIVECHPALVGAAAVRFRDLLNRASSGTLEVAMGLEIADDAILAKLNKRMTLAMFARGAEFLRKHDIAMRAFVMVKPPFVRAEEEALMFSNRSVDFAFDCGATAMSLIPARFGAEELGRLAESGDFAPPELSTLEAALDYGIGLHRGRVFADVWDLEKFTECSDCFAARRERLVRMNLEQAVSPRIDCGSCARPKAENGSNS
jgi:radical SAM enzyme (TIGR01210 family)